MRRCAVFLVWCASVAWAVEAPPVAKPFVEIVIPSGSQLIAHGSASVLGKAWKDPGVAALRTRAERELTALNERFGLDFWQVLEQGRNFRLSLHLKSGAAHDKPGFTAQVDLGAQAAAVFEHLAKEGVAEPLPTADGAVTVTWAGTDVHVQRRGTWLLAHSDAAVAESGVAVPTGHDLSVHVDGPLLLKSLLAAGGSELQASEPWLRRLLIDNTTTFDLVSDGFAIESNLGAPWKALRPADLQVLDQLPSTTLEVTAVGVDGPALWEEIGRPATELWSRAYGPVPPQPLHELGCDLPLETVIRGVSGTWAFAITPSAPMPGYAVIVPRSESTDAVVAALVAQIKGTVPDEGAALPLPLPIPLPILLNLARNCTHWLLTTDAMLAPTWLAGGGASWLASPLGTLATRTAGGVAPVVSVTDTAAQIRMMLPYLGMMASQISILAPAEKQSLTVFVARLAMLASPGWAVLRPVGDHLQASSRGLTTSNSAIGMVAVVAAIAVPNLLESRTAANEAAAAATLKSGIFPAQIQFQSGAYLDVDNDGRGEFAPEIALLAGKTTATMTRPLSLIAPPFNAPQPVLRNGYRFAIFTFGDAAKNFVAYAWPDSRDQGRRAFALTNTGMLYERPWTITDQPLTTYALWGGSVVALGEVEPDPAWKRYDPSRKSDNAENDRSPRKKSANQIRQLILGAAVFANDNDGKNPKDFTELIDSTGGDLSAKSLSHPAHPERKDAYLYVRAWPAAKSTQPLIVEDPAVWNGEGCWVGYCDGHVAWLKRADAAAVWAHAKTLAGSPQAMGEGLKAQDWAPVQARLDQKSD